MKELQKHLEGVSYLKSVQALLHWDMETMMPSGAIDDRAKRLCYLESKIHEQMTGKTYKKLLKKFSQNKTKSKLERKICEELLWDYKLSSSLPSEYVEKLSLTATHANHVWAISKNKNDLKSFLPHLQKLIDLKRKETSFYNSKVPYDSLIKLHDKEFDSKSINIIFNELKQGLLTLTSKVESERRFVDCKDLKGPFNLDQQKEINLFIAKQFGLPAENSRLDVSTHPFSINISPLDQRITTRYDLSHLDSISSTMHEVGHALYELNLPKGKWDGSPYVQAISLSVHESQSRFWENIIGRSYEFCHYLHPIMKKHFSLSMKGVSEKDLFYYFNKSVPGLIRVESSELYYNFHIIIRFEIEEMIFNQGLNAKDIPQIWKEKYKKYLGIIPKNDSEGLLQDSHWASGAFGYFPTYTLGNIISGSIYTKMKKEIPKFNTKVSSGDFTDLLKYLVKNIHSKGRTINSKDIVGKINVADYLNYLHDKFSL